jgi:amino acid transporter
MAVILATLFMGISFIASRVGAVPSELETVISQIGRTVFGGQGILYFAIILATTIILLLAGNTAYAGFPRLSALMAMDGFLPRQLTYRGSRLVYSRGIVALAVLSSLLIILFQASVTRLIPLYAIGVFLSFTMAQSGMALRWWKSGKLRDQKEDVEHTNTRVSKLTYDPLWRFKMITNGFGALCTGVVMFIFAITKFHDGAYVILILIPALIGVLWLIHIHFRWITLASFRRTPSATGLSCRSVVCIRERFQVCVTPACCLMMSLAYISWSNRQMRKRRVRSGRSGAKASAW